jgi:prepilin-type N-terminal cleavage/methylation domain-containing protein
MAFADPCRDDISIRKDSLQRFVVEKIANSIAEQPVSKDSGGPSFQWYGQRATTSPGAPMTPNKKGFTLIELLIVVVIIGILAAIAIPKFSNTKEKAYVAAMKSDLRNLATYEEQYAADNNGAYFGGTATSAAPLQGFSPSQNVTITVTNIAGPPPSWTASAVHSQTAKTCDSNITAQGVITCT